jgi:hypothetical protein
VYGIRCRGDQTGLVWEMLVLAFERERGVEMVLACRDESDIDGYLMSAAEAAT